MIRVKSLQLHNIGPFAEQEIDFSVKEGHPDIHIFTGINGTGKTTILHAIAATLEHFEDPEKHVPYTRNNFHKRFHQFNSEASGKYGSFAKVQLDTKSSILSECFGCPICNNVHGKYIGPERTYDADGNVFPPPADLLEFFMYQKGIQSEKPYQRSIGFAAFGYSGYRFISSAKINIANEEDNNPLHGALDFVKKQDTSAHILNWIVSRHAKAAVEESAGNKATAKRYRKALDTLLQSIEGLTGNEYKFEIQTNPWKVVIKYFEKEVDFDVLPDGLRSVLSWMGDLLMRLDNIHWENKDTPVNEQNIVLLLDEIEVHLHPSWQYKILPFTRDVFPKAQIFVTTHSPFILNSIDKAKIYKLSSKNGESELDGFELSETGNSYNYVYENILETHNLFGYETMEDLKRFDALDKEIVQKNYENEAEFRKIIQRLLDEGLEVTDIISSKLVRLKRITGKDFFHGENHEKTTV